MYGIHISATLDSEGEASWFQTSYRFPQLCKAQPLNFSREMLLCRPFPWYLIVTAPEQKWPSLLYFQAALQIQLCIIGSQKALNHGNMKQNAVKKKNYNQQTKQMNGKIIFVGVRSGANCLRLTKFNCIKDTIHITSASNRIFLTAQGWIWE